MGQASERRITFYHAPRTRSTIVHWFLEELGQPYETRLLDLERGEHKTQAYLAVNSMGKVPAVVHDGVAVTEVAAICCHLADAFPAAGLSIPIGDPRRGPYLRWLFFAVGCIEPAVLDRTFRRPEAPSQRIGYGSLDAVVDVLADALEPGPHLLGEPFTAADVVVGAQLRWARMMEAIPRRPPIVRYVERLGQRPALQRAEAKDAAPSTAA
jgi:glutathione S-transferase